MIRKNLIMPLLCIVVFYVKSLFEKVAQIYAFLAFNGPDYRRFTKYHGPTYLVRFESTLWGDITFIRYVLSAVNQLGMLIY